MENKQIIEPDRTGKSDENAERDERGRFIKGHEGMGGRPKDSFSLTDLQKKYYIEHPEELKKLLEDMREDKKFWRFFWEMVDSRPPTKLNVNQEVKTPADEIKEMLIMERRIKTNDIPRGNNQSQENISQEISQP